MENQIFWKETFKEGTAQGGIFFRSFDLNKFINAVEKQGKEVVGLQFDGNNLQLITITTSERASDSAINMDGDMS